MPPQEKTRSFLTLVLLSYTGFLEALSKTGKFWGGFYSLIILIICAVMAYVCIIGFSANKDVPNSDNKSVGCMIYAYIIFALFALFVLLKTCS